MIYYFDKKWLRDMNEENIYLYAESKGAALGALIYTIAIIIVYLWS